MVLPALRGAWIADGVCANEMTTIQPAVKGKAGGYSPSTTSVFAPPKLVKPGPYGPGAMRVPAAISASFGRTTIPSLTNQLA